MDSLFVKGMDKSCSVLTAMTDSHQSLVLYRNRSSITESTLQIWELLDSILPNKNLDHIFWWNKTGIPYAILLHEAGHSMQSQFLGLLFYFHYVAPELGPAMNKKGTFMPWKSFMTDHFSPIELSWEWSLRSTRPTIRFSWEPIGPHAGTLADPLNQYAAESLARRYQLLLPSCDLTLFDYFSARLLSYNNSADEHDHQSRSFVALDPGEEDHPMLKAYFLPTFKAAEMRLNTWNLIRTSILDLSNSNCLSDHSFGLTALTRFLDSSPNGAKLKAEMLAIDCVEPVKSRLKLYMRTPKTSFLSVRDIMTLGGLLDDASLTICFRELYRLWKLVFSLGSDYMENQELQSKNHRTAGILYYFDIKQGKALPSVKIYLPVRHYGRDDLTIADGLKKYLDSHRRDGDAGRFLKALHGIVGPNTLQDSRGLQTYIGCSFVDEQLKLTSYLAP